MLPLGKLLSVLYLLGKHMPVTVPEIDPSSGMAALTLLAGTVAVIRGWCKKVTDPPKASPAALGTVEQSISDSTR